MTLAKVGKATLHLSVGKVALNGWYQGGLKSQTNIIRSSWTPSSSAFKYLAPPPSREYMDGKQLLVPGRDNLIRPISAPAVTLSQQPYTSFSHKN
ncbi:hypothetical protein T10_13484 [Trichinella papuae]|uniref:Uncharacterized protein n=1 Tax=Trichinella papuae TaxID=268474 RepID=A0A0V1N8H1_9BILA|nr:hypothetical protein T10_13484 [Trichinella papuae]